MTAFGSTAPNSGFRLAACCALIFAAGAIPVGGQAPDAPAGEAMATDLSYISQAVATLDEGGEAGATVATNCPECQSAPSVTTNWPDGQSDPSVTMDCFACRSGSAFVPCELDPTCDSGCGLAAEVYPADTVLGRFCAEIVAAICCPDPCYEPRWHPLADAAFFTEAARPVTQQRFRWDAGFGMTYPDRAEFFWARADGHGRGPSPIAPALGETNLDYHEVSMYTEAASGAFSAFVITPYRSNFGDSTHHSAGFSDIRVGTKTLVFDCELLQIAFVFRTDILSGKVREGLGTGHMSLEPSLVFGLNVSPRSYVQAQIAQWIPLGGNSTYEGGVLHYHFALNHTLCHFSCQVPLIATAELNGYTFQDGSYTDPASVPVTQSATGETYLSVAPGLRLFICDKIDFGVAGDIGLTSPSWTDATIRSEFRMRF